MAGLRKPSPLEYSKLTWKQKTYYLAAWYLDRCTEEPLFVNGRPSKALGQVRGYFEHKVSPSSLQCLYDAVSSLEDKKLIGIYDLYGLSEKVRCEQRMQSGANGVEVAQYPSLLDCLKGL